MRLINVHTLKFQNFFDEQTPPYAVVSHRWGEKELSFEEYTAGGDTTSHGYIKIVQCAEIAKSRGRDWIWVDTVCIDKSSSAELTEAINSMYEWYRGATECYAILPDLTHSPDKTVMQESLRQSVYFTRGWTLQELLAPHEVYFYDSAFHYYASKIEMAELLYEITGIRQKYLEDPRLISTACVAEKMSWMSSRRLRICTRIEDTAYCLLGLFGVNMPLLYGEREKAFFRLQLEIIKNIDDESIFAWTSKEREISGMLAHWPSDFAESDNIRTFAISPQHRVPWVWSSKGLEVRLVETNTLPQAKYDPFPVGQNSKILTLGCWKDTEPSASDDDEASYVRLANKIVAINLERDRSTVAWQRTGCNRTILVTSFNTVSRMGNLPLQLRHYYIPQDPPQQEGGYVRW